ncbi:alpha/beta fold hydrolase [Lutibacter sp.]|uniref:alpha/beta fold hydrolase n=1 Tax=Lutibacter sp. TaxID=1925666 RepID=UPI0025C4DC1B|nr:alpha/beta fold hydrolase [Lutibacter sp.]MCF6182688.1 alpha/beta hydrolase [Lutibacter sp.]
MKKRLKQVLKIIGFLILAVIILVIVQFYRFSNPKSDVAIFKTFKKHNVPVFIEKKEFKSFDYRVLSTQKVIDTNKTTIVFIHGSIGSALDFKKYMLDSILRKKSNLITYDRIGYGIYQTGNVQESIAFEKEMLEDLTRNLNPKKTILVGYSYGGPIAMASKKKYKKIILLAPAMYSSEEKMPWLLNFYKWKITRWLVPKTWQAASKEKLSHKADLQYFEKLWNENPSTIICIQGADDWIVPYQNSLLLQQQISPEKFKLVTLKNAGHGLVWTNFKEIKQVLIQQLN